MSNKKLSGVPDLSDVMKFWEMKDEIFDELAYLIVQVAECACAPEIYLGSAIELKTKIESLGKKEKE